MKMTGETVKSARTQDLLNDFYFHSILKIRSFVYKQEETFFKVLHFSCLFEH